MAVGLAREHARESLPEPVLGEWHTGFENVCQSTRMEVDPEHGRPSDHGAVTRVECIDPRHRRRADALGELFAIARGRGRQQIEQKLGTAAGTLDGQLHDMWWHLACLGAGKRQIMSVVLG